MLRFIRLVDQKVGHTERNLVSQIVGLKLNLPTSASVDLYEFTDERERGPI